MEPLENQNPPRTGTLNDRCPESKFEFAEHLRKNPTPQEKKLWRRLKQSRLGVPLEFQAVIAGYIVDIYFPSARLGIEVDGPVHDNRKEYDEQRESHLKRHGIDLLRVSNEDVDTDLNSVVRLVRGCLDRSGSTMRNAITVREIAREIAREKVQNAMKDVGGYAAAAMMTGYGGGRIIKKPEPIQHSADAHEDEIKVNALMMVYKGLPEVVKYRVLSHVVSSNPTTLCKDLTTYIALEMLDLAKHL